MKRLTESVLYDFLPAALNAMLPQQAGGNGGGEAGGDGGAREGSDASRELDADGCRVRVGLCRGHAEHGNKGVTPCMHEATQPKCVRECVEGASRAEH